jgi:DNA adenine methylase
MALQFSQHTFAAYWLIGYKLSVIEKCKEKGVNVALSIDGTKRSDNLICDLPLPDNLFEREILIDIGHSMLKRFQMNGKTLGCEKVSDRLLLNY